MGNPLKRWLQTRYIGQNAVILDEIVSTNYFAKELLSKNPKNGTVIIAKKQTGGRGQRSNVWISPEGGLYYSCIINAKAEEKITLITLACGLAVSDTVNEIASVKSTVKWVNDVLIGGKKVAGILLESRLRADKATLIIGIGLNVNSSAKDLPLELQSSSTTLMDETSRQYDINKVAAILSNNIEKYLELYSAGNFKLLKSILLQKSETFGKTITVNEPNRKVEGVVIDINDNGELMLQSFDGKIYCFSSNLNIVYKDN